MIVAACGGPIDDEAPNKIPAPAECTGCMVEETEPAVDPEPWTRPAHVAATPREVLFYSELGSASAELPRLVRVVNTTSSTVLMTSAYIVDIETLMQEGNGDSAYFRVEVPTIEEPLAPGDEADLFVTFALSSAQRTAMLVIETTHPAYQSLVVSLAGKTFVNW